MGAFGLLHAVHAALELGWPMLVVALAGPVLEREGKLR